MAGRSLGLLLKRIGSAGGKSALLARSGYITSAGPLTDLYRRLSGWFTQWYLSTYGTPAAPALAPGPEAGSVSRYERRRLIAEIEELRGSRVLAFVTGDRGPIPAQIGEDAVTPIDDELEKMGDVERLDIFLSSRGGAIDVPWRIACDVREVAEQWSVLVPYHANSAATLLSLGADEIILGRRGELGPIDPILTSSRMSPDKNSLVHDAVSVEDVMAYLRFIRERVGLTDQEAVGGAALMLLNRIDALLVGTAERTHSHVRDVARKMLLSRSEPPGEQDLTRIVQILAEKVYAHNHAITLPEALECGLPARRADKALDRAMRRLLKTYEADLKVREPVDPAYVTEDTDLYVEEDTVAAVVETTAGSHELTAQLHIQAKREIPPDLKVPLNLNFQFPDHIQMENADQGIQALWQQFQQGIQPYAEQAIRQSLRDQALVTDIQTSLRGAKWRYYDAAEPVSEPAATAAAE